MCSFENELWYADENKNVHKTKWKLGKDTFSLFSVQWKKCPKVSTIFRKNI